jgi:hypothetical protein
MQPLHCSSNSHNFIEIFDLQFKYLPVTIKLLRLEYFKHNSNLLWQNVLHAMH